MPVRGFNDLPVDSLESEGGMSTTISSPTAKNSTTFLMILWVRSLEVVGNNEDSFLVISMQIKETLTIYSSTKNVQCVTVDGHYLTHAALVL